MSTIITRETGDTAKNAPLTNSELDGNFINLNGDKMEKASNLSDVSNTASARTNLGLGSAATSDTTDFDAAGTAVALAIALG